ncbi:GIY-YIG nuclease family protein [Rossellomorea marisflavi]|uniref:GIY-YIG nuclease family protein n=1 Tax=Rossellomorea marisflavi TaxID=189381 RepID=UPI0025B0BA77|nr:GIY-YIG nuclease family protein [Rossellomorea marisflavi]WJV20676.1 GIY-YIG nuclease family protein [Rossellomorea marisflavi]
MKKFNFKNLNEDKNDLKFPGIYRIINSVNGKSYVGQTSTPLHKRLKSHLSALKSNRHGNNHLQRSFNKYGNVFFFEIIAAIEDISKSELNKLEFEYIEEFESYTNGYNSTKGGDGSLGCFPGEETRKKQSLAKIGRTPWNKGKKGAQKASEETRLKISNANKGKFYGESHSQAKVTEEQVKTICEMIIEGKTIKEISCKLKIDKHIVNHIRYGNSWGHIVKNYEKDFPKKERLELKKLKESLTPKIVYEKYIQIGNQKRTAAHFGVGALFVRDQVQKYKEEIENGTTKLQGQAH